MFHNRRMQHRGVRCHNKGMRAMKSGGETRYFILPPGRTNAGTMPFRASNVKRFRFELGGH